MFRGMSLAVGLVYGHFQDLSPCLVLMALDVSSQLLPQLHVYVFGAMLPNITVMDSNPLKLQIRNKPFLL